MAGTKVSTSVSLDQKNRAMAQELFERMGLDMSTAVNVFLAKCISVGGFPFRLALGDEPIPKSAVSRYEFLIDGRFFCSREANEALSAYCEQAGIAPASLSCEELLALMDSFFAVLSERFPSIDALVMVLAELCEGTESSASDAYVDGIWSFQSGDLVRLSASTNRIIKMVGDLMERVVSEVDVFSMLDFVTGSLPSVAWARAAAGERNGRVAQRSDAEYHKGCLLEEITLVNYRGRKAQDEEGGGVNLLRILDPGWTEEEDDIIRQFYPKEGSDVCNRLSDRTRPACKARALALGIPEILLGWTKEEDDIIRQFYPSGGANVSARLPGRTRRSCQQRALTLGVGVESKWTEMEDDIIRQFYPKEGSDVCNRLPGRTRRACQQRARILGIRAEARKWTAMEDSIIRQLYPTEGPDVCKRLPDRTRAQCVARAKQLGLFDGSRKD